MIFLQRSCKTTSHLCSADNFLTFIAQIIICPGLTANETNVLYDEHHKVSSLNKVQKVQQKYVILSNMNYYENGKMAQSNITHVSFNPGHKCLFLVN